MQIYADLEQGSPEWLKLRAGVITGTGLENIMKGEYLLNGNLSAGAKKSITEYCYELIGGELSYDEEAPIKSSYLMDQGNNYEALAKLKYEAIKGEKPINVGFVKKNERVGLSPDGVIFKDNKITKAIEIKSPLGNNSKNWYKYVTEDVIPKDYLWQVVHYFIVLEDLEELDFCVFNPNFIHPDRQLWIKTIKREDIKDLIQQAEKRLEEARVIWLELLKKFIK